MHEVCRAPGEDDFVHTSLAEDLFEAYMALSFHRFAEGLQLGLLRFVQFLEAWEVVDVCVDFKQEGFYAVDLLGQGI